MERRRQLELFDAPRRAPAKPAAPYQAGSVTSKAAAEVASGKRARRLETAVAILRGRGAVGITRDELANASGWPIQSVCPLVDAMLKKGLAIATDATRKTRTGRAAEVLVATAAK